VALENPNGNLSAPIESPLLGPSLPFGALFSSIFSGPKTLHIFFWGVSRVNSSWIFFGHLIPYLKFPSFCLRPPVNFRALWRQGFFLTFLETLSTFLYALSLGALGSQKLLGAHTTPLLSLKTPSRPNLGKRVVKPRAPPLFGVWQQLPTVWEGDHQQRGFRPPIRRLFYPPIVP